MLRFLSFIDLEYILKLGGDTHDSVPYGLIGGGKPHGPKFDLTKNYAPVDATDDFMLRKLPPMEVTI